MKNAFKIFVVKPEGKRPLEDVAIVDGRIIIEWMSGKYGGQVWLRIVTSGGVV
jgi:hypothetical protein